MIEQVHVPLPEDERDNSRVKDRRGGDLQAKGEHEKAGSIVSGVPLEAIPRSSRSSVVMVALYLHRRQTGASRAQVPK